MKNTRYFKLFTVIIFTLLSISCSFWDNPQNNKNINDDKFILNGSINLDASRAALPSIPSGEYFVSATDGIHEAIGDVENGTYLISLERNKAWTVTAGLKSADSQTILMIDTWSIPQTNTAATLSHNFVLKPVTSENGSGSLGLTIVLNNDLDGIVSKVTADCKSTNSDEWEVTITPYEELTFVADSPLEISVSDSQITSGQYEVSFNFYNNTNVLVYNTVQTINIFDNLTTDTWSSSGSVGPIKTDGSFELTKALVDGYSQTHLYVGATAFSDPPSDTNANGSATKPFASVTGAVNYLKKVGNNQQDYTIYVVGTVDGAQEIKDDFTDDGTGNETVTTIPANSITLKGFKGLDDNDVPQDVLDGGLDEANEGQTLLISTSIPVTIKNLTITGGYQFNNYGAGISVSGNSKVYLEDGTLITGNHSEAAGAAIGIIDSATVTMNGGVIENNSSKYEFEGTDFSGTVVIFKEDRSEEGTPKFIMNGGTIKKNTTFFYGGGVGVALDGVFEMNGGTIGGTSDEDANIADSSDSSGYANGSSTYGGGVYVGSGGSFTMNGGVISHNKAPGIGTDPSNSGTHGNCGGGGVAVCEGGSFEMKTGNTNGVTTTGTISSNTSARNGGGVYIDSDSTFTMTAGTISGNTSTDEGKGVYLYSSSSVFQMGGSALVQPDGSNVNDVYLPTGAKITISEDFDGNIECAALITPGTYENTTVLETENNVDLTHEYDVFKVTSQQVDNTTIEYWTVDETGKLAVTSPYSIINNSAYWSFDETFSAIQEAEGETSIIIYPFITATELGKVGTEGSLLYEINQNQNATFAITIKNCGENKIVLPTDSSYMFANCENITAVSFDGVDTTNITDVSHMFEKCTALTSINLGDEFGNHGSINSSRIQTLDYMFSECTGLTEIDVTPIAFSVAASFNYTFNGCSNIKFIYLKTGTTWYYQNSDPDFACKLTGENMFLGCVSIRYSSFPTLSEGTNNYNQNKVGIEMARFGDVMDPTLGYFSPTSY